MTPNQSSLRCSACGQPFPAQVRTVVDAQTDPQGKSLLMSGRLNVFPCPHCGHTNQVLTPLLYHDPSKQLLIAFIPMEVSMKSGQPEEKIIGELMNDLTRSIGKENFRSYMFNPRRALTIQGLIEQVMEADGITPEMMNAQKKRVELIQKLLETQSEDQLITVIKENDTAIDAQFLQTMSLMAQRVLEDGRQEIAMALMSLQQVVVQHTTYGKELMEAQTQQQALQEEVVRAVAEDINALSEGATREDIIELAIRYADEDSKLQALVGLVRGAFDYQLFLEFITRIEKAPEGDKERLKSVRDRVQAYAQAIDQQSQQQYEGAVQFLQMLIQSSEQEALIEANLEMIDNEFMTVLNANLQEAQRRNDENAMTLLRGVYDNVVKVLQSQMSPEMRFLNQLLGVSDEMAMRQRVAEEAGQFDKQVLLDTCDSVMQALTAQGQTGTVQRLSLVREAIAQR